MSIQVNINNKYELLNMIESFRKILKSVKFDNNIIDYRYSFHKSFKYDIDKLVEVLYDFENYNDDISYDDYIVKNWKFFSNKNNKNNLSIFEMFLLDFGITLFSQSKAHLLHISKYTKNHKFVHFYKNIILKIDNTKMKIYFMYFFTINTNELIIKNKILLEFFDDDFIKGLNNIKEMCDILNQVDFTNNKNDFIGLLYYEFFAFIINHLKEINDFENYKALVNFYKDFIIPKVNEKISKSNNLDDNSAQEITLKNIFSILFMLDVDIYKTYFGTMEICKSVTKNNNYKEVRDVIRYNLNLMIELGMFNDYISYIEKNLYDKIIYKKIFVFHNSIYSAILFDVITNDFHEYRDKVRENLKSIMNLFNPIKNNLSSFVENGILSDNFMIEYSNFII